MSISLFNLSKHIFFIDSVISSLIFRTSSTRLEEVVIVLLLFVNKGTINAVKKVISTLDEDVFILNSPFLQNCCPHLFLNNKICLSVVSFLKISNPRSFQKEIIVSCPSKVSSMVNSNSQGVVIL